MDDLFRKIMAFYIPQLVSIADQPAWDIFIYVILIGYSVVLDTDYVLVL